MTPTERILAALADRNCDPKKSGNGWKARCPAHKDRTPSLSISEGDDGRVLLHCYVGCSLNSICGAVEMKPADLFPSTVSTSTQPRESGKKRQYRRQDNGKPAGKNFSTARDAVAALDGMMAKEKGRRVGQWTYHDAQGDPVAVIARYDLPTPKGVKQEKSYRPVARCGDQWAIGGMPEPRPLYCLPDLSGADRVFITEGEKAADAARAIGLTATTSAHGSQSADKADWSPLAGKECVILPDHDEPGGKYADAVTAILAKLTPPAVVKVVDLPDLPEHGDIVDWIDAHGDAAEPDELRQQVEALADRAEAIQPDRPESSTEGEAQDTMADDDQKDSWPDALADEAFHGLAGEIVRTIEPHSEADPVAILIQVLIAFGNLIGRSAFFRAEADRHYGNLFSTLVGVTSKGRKGTSWGQVRRLVALVALDWCKGNIASGLSSGEGLIWGVRDPIKRMEPIREGNKRTGKILEYQEIIADEGIDDKRLLILESEFASVLQVCSREKNTLSAIIRQAWDTGNLRTMTKNSPACATDSHVSIVGHVTRDELRRLITATDMANGLANRFLWICVRRSKQLPEGGNLRDEALMPLAGRLQRAVQIADGIGEMRRDDAARTIWRKVYGVLSSGKSGLLGAATSRAEAQVMRLAMLYALLEESRVIKADHLTAALAVWQYAEQSAKYIFGSALGDPVADEILRALQGLHPAGMTRTEIRDLFHKHRKASEIGASLELLDESGLARSEKATTGGRSAETWFAIM